MISLKTLGGVIEYFPDYIFSSQRVKYSNGKIVYIDGKEYDISSLKKINDQATGTGTSSNEETMQISDLPFDGNRMVKRSGIPQVNTGTTSALSFLDEYFFPFVGATIMMNGDALTILEYGLSSEVYISAKFTGNDEEEAENYRIVETTNNNSIIATSDSGFRNFDFGKAINIEGRETSTSINHIRSYMALADVGNDGKPKTITSTIKSFCFYMPSFWGMNESKILTNTQLFTNVISKSIIANTVKSFTISFNGEDQYIHFYTPYQSGKPTIKDNNGFDVSSSFEVEQIELTTPNIAPNWTSRYYHWSTKTKTTIANKIFTINF